METNNTHPTTYYVDLDGTLAHYTGWKSPEDIGEPIPAMMERVKAWLMEGKPVKIFTARFPEHHGFVREWLFRHGLGGIPVTNVKGIDGIEFWDDRAVPVEPNTGRNLIEVLQSLKEGRERDMETVKTCIEDAGQFRVTIAALRKEITGLRAELSERRAEQAPMGEEIVRLRQRLHNMNAIRKLLTQGDDIRTEEIRGVEDVPLCVPERASDEELGAIGRNRYADLNRRTPDHYDKYHFEYVAAAIRARVEAPLLAEIQRLEAKVLSVTISADSLAARCEVLGERQNVVTAERDTLKARVAELKAEIKQAGIDFELAVKSRDWQHEAHLACKKLADELLAKLEAIKEIPEIAELITCRPDESLSTAVMRLRNERNDLCNKLSSRDERIASLVSELEAVKAERDELRGVRERLMLIVEQQAQELQDDPQFRACRKELSELKIELAALHQPVDADAWKTELRIDCPLGGEQTLFVGDSICATVNVYAHGRHENSGLSPADAARAAQWLASYAAAHGCPVGLPPILSGLPEAMQATEPRKWTQSFAENLPAQLIAEEHNRAIDALSENAVIDVPKGVPSLQELVSSLMPVIEEGTGSFMQGGLSPSWQAWVELLTSELLKLLAPHMNSRHEDPANHLNIYERDAILKLRQLHCEEGLRGRLAKLIDVAYSGPTRAEAQAKISEMGLTGGLGWDYYNALKDWILSRLPETTKAPDFVDLAREYSETPQPGPDLQSWIDTPPKTVKLPIVTEQEIAAVMLENRGIVPAKDNLHPDSPIAKDAATIFDLLKRRGYPGPAPDGYPTWQQVKAKWDELTDREGTNDFEDEGDFLNYLEANLPHSNPNETEKESAA